MSWKDLKMLLASEIVRNPEKDLEGYVRTVYDQTIGGLTWDNLEKALNILAEKGWKPVCMAVYESSALRGAKLAYVIIEKKR
ncbi:MAG: hypothetical protein QW334_00375 [Thermofilum sp.]